MKKQHLVLALLFLALLAVTLLTSSSNAAGLGPDILYVGDEIDNTVKSFSAQDGKKGAFVTQNTTGRLVGPMGLLIAGPELIVVNQNVNLPLNGEILQYQLKDGSFTGAWVPSSDPNAPFAPRGAALKDGIIYVAEFVADNSGTPGAVLAFAGNGDLLGKLTPPTGFTTPFHPRGVVVGSDGLLYVSNVPTFPPATGGQVLRFDPNTLRFKDVFVDDKGGMGRLNRPEGLVFGPDGNLYITSFRASMSDTDSIRIYDGDEGRFLDKIELDQVGQARAFAQALLFGPGGKLFIPISGPFGNPDTGQVRRYDVSTKVFDVFVPAGTLGVPFYLTFGRTNSATLRYGFQIEHEGD
jgi:predicted small secreted protein